MMNRIEHIDSCRMTVEKYRKEHSLCVFYVRKGGHIPLPPQVRQGQKPVFDLLQKIFSEPAFLRYPAVRIMRVMENLWGFPIPKDKDDREAYRLFIDACRAYIRMKHQPRIGVLVCFRMNGTSYVGWSLCHWKMGDHFNSYMGIREAIKRAVEVREVAGEFCGSEGLGLCRLSDDDPMPHTVAPYLPLVEKRLRIWNQPKEAVKS